MLKVWYSVFLHAVHRGRPATRTTVSFLNKVFYLRSETLDLVIFLRSETLAANLLRFC